jgi:predicted nucleic acid-binding protein
MELILGARNAKEQAQFEAWINRFRVAWLTAAGGDEALRQFRRFHLVSGMSILDVLIAQVAITLQCELLTFNQRHFTVIEGLATRRPYQR